MKILNPYNDIDFGSITRVKAISHEHIGSENPNLTKESLRSAYDRGIRYFACVWYQPAALTYPLSAWNHDYQDYTSKDDLTLKTWNYDGSVVSFEDGNNNTILTDDLPQIPNAEHPCFSNINSNHFNVLGTSFSEAGWGKINMENLTSWRMAHPLYDVSQINSLFANTGVLNNKIFGTINHCGSFADAKKFLNNGRNVFKAMELFNQDATEQNNRKYKLAYDELLSTGERLWVAAVVDWQGSRNANPNCPYDRGCNVLLMDSSYNALPANCFDPTNNYVYSKAEAGLDAYIDGKYYASGLGNHYITGIEINNDKVTVSFDSTASTIKAITNVDVKEVTNSSSISYTIPRGAIYLRFEAEFNDWDFIYTNPMWIEDNEGDSVSRNLLILGI